MRHVIDFHHHWMPREHVDHLERYIRPREELEVVTLSDGQVSKRVTRDGMAMLTASAARYTIDERLENMDAANVAAAVFTLGTYTSWMENLRICQEVNDGMAKVVSDGFDAHVEERARKQAARPARRRKPAPPAAVPPADPDWARRRRAELGQGIKVPAPPFWGPRVIDRVAPKALTAFLNERMLFQFHWGYRKEGRSLKQYMAWARKELRPKLKRLIDTVVEDRILAPQACYGYWKAAAEGDAVILFAEDGVRELARFELPRAGDGERKCIADYLRDVADGPDSRDVVAMQVVTVGQRASDVAREWFADDRYQDYVFLHGLGVEMAEALAEYVHKRIRAELGFGHEDARAREELFSQGYRGSRYSFGYPACPNLADQHKILGLLGADRIELEMGEEDQLHPEQSTSAIVVHHPQAKYFSV